MSSYLSEIITLLTSGIVGLGQGIATGVNAFVQALFIDSSGTTPQLSQFMGVVAIFGGIGLAVGLTAKLFNWLISLGARN